MTEEEKEEEAEEVAEEDVEKERCRIAYQAVLNVLAEQKCIPEGGLEEIGDMLGFSPEELKEMNPISERCRDVLKEPLSKDRCYDFREIRRWVMCKTWDIMETERVPFREAIRRGWEVAKEQCRKASAYI